MKSDSKKSKFVITDYFKLQKYEKIPFSTYPLFLLILVPIFLTTPATESELSGTVIILAFVIALTTTGASFLIIHYKRKGEIIGITAIKKEKKTDVNIERYSFKNYPFELKTTNDDEIIKGINDTIIEKRIAEKEEKLERKLNDAETTTRKLETLSTQRT